MKAQSDPTPSVVSALNAPCLPEPLYCFVACGGAQTAKCLGFFFNYNCTILPSVGIIQGKKLMGSRARSLPMMISKPPFKKTRFQARFYLNSQHFSILETFVAIAVLVCILTCGETTANTGYKDCFGHLH